ncbi:MULE transposase domain containing protein [Nitzschia inconspicua]|uniref:MULE transposase domain containing protein n=1 Tax=Nitzschia inconspicua TaxID=303405 RepID=A0A9K3L816_9STRA|nr:MULE transposase domain containing protein [Nitzschia inconspicua]
MHPESISCDATFGTENTKKQLFTLATRDGNNKAFNCGVAYIPNGQAWVFWHCFRYCLKTLWGETVTKRVSLMCTDGCVQEYQAFINNAGEGGSFPNAVHTLCYFHTATLSFNKNVSLPVGTDPEEMHRAIDVGSGSVLKPHIVNSIKTWVTTHLRPLEKMWLNVERLYLCTMDLRTTSISESMHASMKSGFDGVRAGMDTTSSANAVVGKSTRRQKQQQRLNAREQERTVKWSEMPTTRHLTEYCLMKAKEEWDVANTCKNGSRGVVGVQGTRLMWRTICPSRLHSAPPCEGSPPKFFVVLLWVTITDEVSVSTHIRRDEASIDEHVWRTMALAVPTLLWL